MPVLKDFISIEALEKRWGCNKDFIESFTHKNPTTAYLTKWYCIETRTRPDGCKSTLVKPAMYLNGCIFNMKDVLGVESNYPELLQEKDAEYIPAEDLREKLRLSPTEEDARIAELEAQLAAATEEAAKRKEAQAVTEANTTVKAAKWENSVSAAFDLWNEIFQGNKNSWTRDEFTTALAKKYPDYHTKVLTLAWSRLPEKYKQGPGRPKICENPKNP